MVQPRRAFCTLAAVLALALPPADVSTASQAGEDKKPSLSLRATPPLGFSPLRVRVVVDVRGGSDHYSDYYGPNIEWVWGDGTVSESAEDCDPYEEGKSTIRRRFSSEHVFRQAGSYQVYFRLKQRDKVISAASGQVQVRAGLREEFGN